jgi:hypothetical protein
VIKCTPAIRLLMFLFYVWFCFHHPPASRMYQYPQYPLRSPIRPIDSCRQVCGRSQTSRYTSIRHWTSDCLGQKFDSWTWYHSCSTNCIYLSIYKTYLATNNTHTKPPDYQRMLRIRLLFRLNLEMHYSTWKDDVEKFKSYWLHENILGQLQEGRILLTEQV